MNSISQLLDLIKSLQSNLFVFSTQLEPLMLVNDVPSSISSHINSLDFINLIDDCSRSILLLSEFIYQCHSS